jgi:hypothetical protein
MQEPQENIKTEFINYVKKKIYNIEDIEYANKGLSEMAIAAKGDWPKIKEMVTSITPFIIEKKWDYIDSLYLKNTIYRIYKQKNVYVLGYFIERAESTEFIVELEIKLSLETEIMNEFNFKKQLMNVDGVRVSETSQGRGLATQMYKFLVKNENFIILGDEIQFFGARKLWSRLSKEIDVRVDIIDIDSIKVLEKDVILKHGTDDWDFDKRVWSYDLDKRYIRLVLKEIK